MARKLMFRRDLLGERQELWTEHDRELASSASRAAAEPDEDEQGEIDDDD